MRKQKAAFREFKEFYDQLDNPSRLFEKEYIFDEGLGESLKEHVESLKSEFPDL